MNVDYVSKKFLKETGVKFSSFLADLRINKAKELGMEVIALDGWECKILKNTKTKIELVKLTKVDEKFGD